MGGRPPPAQQQRAAIQAVKESSAPLSQAVDGARNALNAAIYTDEPDAADIKAKAEKLAAAEMAPWYGFHPRSAQYKRPRKSKYRQ